MCSVESEQILYHQAKDPEVLLDNVVKALWAAEGPLARTKGNW